VILDLGLAYTESAKLRQNNHALELCYLEKRRAIDRCRRDRQLPAQEVPQRLLDALLGPTAPFSSDRSGR
jgi:hypothetical protein